ncbi:Low molecular weight antigen MTB12 [Mycobacterium numidiamassiliense]|uniref:Low molecular weight antigen MTB12 n=1 Tax=Mycobacterium numidiamassiliense TaxID=1841861 RepID=A0A2U3PDL9_9MYCO|nr:hypothetical protein [Mycobacterium numidiamassiliense]SPM41833.1 Low molecular weight antigen MTB12 [Mycobacterium numidiamassiliense]
MRSVKAVATGLAALGAIGAAAIGMTSIAATAGATPVRPAAFGAPLPQDPPPAPAPAPGANVPTPDQLTGVLNSLADPSVPFANKSNLVEGGISGTQAHLADHEFKKAADKGDFPLSFNISNIQPGAAGSVTADVVVSGPRITTPVTQNLTFINQGGWVLSRASAMQLIQAAGH